MCRIFGHLNGGVDHSRLAAVGRALRHGGPDQHGVVTGTTWALGATRLAVVDPAGGEQPYRLADRVRVVFNGEIYNHDELRDRLTRLGYRFADRCDGTILPALYDHYGPSFTDHLDGMYAIAVLDLRREPTLVLASDESGMKPLYYHWDGRGGCSFASEIPALRLLAGVGVASSLALDSYLTTKAVFGGRTAYEDIAVLEPATTLVVSTTGLSRFDRAPRGRAAEDADLDRGANLVRHALDREVRRLRRADVRVTAITSGGLDSGLVTALLARHEPRPHGFHIAYRGRWPFDERAFARAVADRSGVELHEVELDPVRLPDLLPTVVAALGQPNADPIAVSTFELFRAVREAGFTVALTGDGADELFGGYDRTRAAVAAGDEWVRGYLDALAAVPRDLRAELYSDDYRQHLADVGTEEDRIVEELRAAGPDRLTAITRFEVASRMPSYHLRRVDHLSMAHAVEARLPFLQPSVTALASALPADLRVRDGIGKRVLTAAGRGLLPDAVLSRPKQPFTLPVAAMLTAGTPLYAFARDVLAPDGVAASGQLDPPAVTGLLDRHATRPRATTAMTIWALLVFQLWAGARALAHPRAEVA
ncbi:asparagine synthase (glutamine-hydrolyzing) [Saccharothrix sp. S26]|uniref:asparagine synthase (glutamine-hydrolyzing) n=1 Tax=Saccharothrix sp. S26 TaxID=2907215 RepID=UPI001F41C50A|nr:asparagine synthase (glutamine-hydrolyzing) [Saccharothrix sp. S26]MCE6995299.1 asparagine synthase (glutamine-hydrolyzing) [Saccharothrix sp. S26]